MSFFESKLGVFGVETLLFSLLVNVQVLNTINYLVWHRYLLYTLWRRSCAHSILHPGDNFLVVTWFDERNMSAIAVASLLHLCRGAGHGIKPV